MPREFLVHGRMPQRPNAPIFAVRRALQDQSANAGAMSLADIFAIAAAAVTFGAALAFVL